MKFLPYIFVLLLIKDSNAFSFTVDARTQGVKEWGRLRKQQKGNRVQEDKMVIDVAFKFLKIVVIGEARNQKGVPQKRN